MKGYLALYNLGSAFGWAEVLRITLTSCFHGDTPLEFWNAVEFPLKIVQSLAGMEVLHSALGLVRSPLLTTIMQVASRLVLLWAYTARSPSAQRHWSLYMMVGSWAVVEVPRYLFYAVNLFTKKVPYPLFFLRYNLFMVLYPSGITGEILQMIQSLPELASLPYKLTLSLLGVYVPSGPFMIMNMFGQRRRAAKARAELEGGGNAKKEVALEGLQFPESGDGDRSTTIAGKRVFAASVAAISPADAKAVENEKNWRFGYAKHVVRNVELSVESPDRAVAIATAGLEEAMGSFDFIRAGTTMKLKDAMEKIKGTFHTGFLKGTGPKQSTTKLTVPYKGNKLSEGELLDQLNKWAAYGTIEPSARDAIAWIVQHPEALDLSSRHFVLLGATSAMGPLSVLLELGANIIAVDLNRSGLWEGLLTKATNSPGTITFPLSKSLDEIRAGGEDASDVKVLAKYAGCNLFTHTPEIKNWLIGVAPGKELVIGGYAYLDSAAHVQVSLAMVAIMEGVMKVRKNTSFAFLCSPTDVFVSPPDAVEAVKDNLRNIPLWQSLVRSLSFGRVLKPNLRRPVAGKTVVNGIVVAQGPNYALAKRLQHWFAIKARSAGYRVSSNIAPSTSTASVVHNTQFAAAYGGFPLFKPMEVFAPETSNAVMGALLIHDIANDRSVSNPAVPLDNDIMLFSSGAFHGGIWRNGFTIDSIGAVAATAFYLKKYSAALALGTAGVIGWVAWLLK